LEPVDAQQSLTSSGCTLGWAKYDASRFSDRELLDHHGDLAKRLPAKCADIDRPIAALITDLRRRGLLDETLIV